MAKANELDELLGFLSSPSLQVLSLLPSFYTSPIILHDYFLLLLQVKKAAVEIVRDLTGSDGGIDILASLSDFSLPPLCLLLHEPLEVSAPASEALINLSQNPSLAEKLVSLRAVDAAMEVIYKQGGSDSRLSRLIVMLLVNLTQLDSGIVSLLQASSNRQCNMLILLSG
ncbi:hypothetical protein KSP39_PZI020215 [Platanthera zijinensis]|uniref:Protein HGH1 homolog n=1 Tax=Platanthera zijinensis TaxID=2320716 RepID=A0AAP0FWM5_9ASPA